MSKTAVVASALTLVAAAVVSVLWTRLRRTACQMSGHGGCCDGRGGRGVTRGSRAGGCVRESARTVGWSRDTVACPGPAGLGWCRSSWGSSWAWPWAAVASQTPAGRDVC